MRVSDIMTKHVHACHPEDSLQEAVAIMRERDCGSVPVLDGRQEVVGMITDRDICLCAADRDEPLSALQISAAITWRPLTCGPDEDIECAEDKMAKHQVRRLPVVDDGGKLVGILALADIARCQAAGKSKTDEKQKVATMVAAISRPMAEASA